MQNKFTCVYESFAINVSCLVLMHRLPLSTFTWILFQPRTEPLSTFTWTDINFVSTKNGTFVHIYMDLYKFCFNQERDPDPEAATQRPQWTKRSFPDTHTRNKKEALLSDDACCLITIIVRVAHQSIHWIDSLISYGQFHKRLQESYRLRQDK